MNAFVNTDASCAALAARYLRGALGALGAGGSSTEVRRLQSMAQVGVDVFQTQLHIEEHQQARVFSCMLLRENALRLGMCVS